MSHKETGHNSLEPPPVYAPGPQEELPEYKSCLSFKCTVRCKRELSSPAVQAMHRNWSKTDIQVHETQLVISKTSGLKRWTRALSLQFAKVGIATDYESEPHCLRVRAEGQQFLFVLETRAMQLDLLCTLELAIAVALPIEMRTIPEQGGPCRRTSVSSEQSCDLDPVKEAPAIVSPDKFDVREYNLLTRTSPWQGHRILYKGKFAFVDHKQTVCILGCM